MARVDILEMTFHRQSIALLPPTKLTTAVIKLDL